MLDVSLTWLCMAALYITFKPIGGREGDKLSKDISSLILSINVYNDHDFPIENLFTCRHFCFLNDLLILL